MPSPNDVKATEYACGHCKRSAVGRYISGGWWQHPVGWLVHDDAARWACSLMCAQELSRPEAEPPT